MQRLDVKEEGIKNQLIQANDRLQDLKEENQVLKQDKEKIFSKLDHFMYENENLRNEIFMLKRIMLEVEKRDMQSGNIMSTLQERLREEPPPQRNLRSAQSDPEIEVIRNRRDRPR